MDNNPDMAAVLQMLANSRGNQPQQHPRQPPPPAAGLPAVSAPGFSMPPFPRGMPANAVMGPPMGFPMGMRGPPPSMHGLPMHGGPGMHPHGGGVYPHGMGGPPPFPSQQQPLGHAMPAGGAASNAAGAGLLAMLQQGGAGGAGAGPTGPPAPVAAPSAAAQPAPGPQRTSSAHLLSTLTPTSATPKTNAKGATTPRVEEPETKHSDGFIHRTEIPDANNVQLDLRSMAKSEGLQVKKITQVKTSPGEYAGKLIAANDNFVCYVLRNGLIRVVDNPFGTGVANPSSANNRKALLRGHEGPVLDVAFASFDVDVLASIGSDGAELLWRVSLDGTQAQKLCDLRSVLGVPRAATPTTRVCWHPSNLGVMAMVNGNTVRVLNVADLITGKDCDVVTAAAYPMSGDITDVCWGETAPGAAMALFVVAGGVVQIMAGKSADGFYAVSQFDDSDPINTVLPLHCDATAITLVCAARGARYISMWKYVPATALASCVQTVSLSCGSDASFSMCRTVSHPTTSHDSALVVATVSAATPVIAVLTADPESSRLTHATTFDVPSRVLSFVSTRPVVGPSGTVQLFCVQPSAVQRYTIPHAAYVASAALSLISENDVTDTPADPRIPPSGVDTASAGRAAEAANTADVAMSAGLLTPSSQAALLRPSSAKALAGSTSGAGAGAGAGAEDGCAGVDAGMGGGSSPAPSPSRRGVRREDVPVEDEGLNAVDEGADSHDDAATAESKGSAGGEDGDDSEDSGDADSLPSDSGSEVYGHTESVVGDDDDDDDDDDDEEEEEEAGLVGAGAGGGGGAAVAAMMQRMEELMAGLEERMEKRERASTQRQARLLQVVSSTLNNQLPGKVAAAVVEQVVPAVSTAVSQSLATRLQPIIADSISSHLPAALQSVFAGQLDDVAARVAGEVAAPATDAFRACFASEVVPAFERGTQAMLSQISATFEAGVGRVVASADESSQRLLGSATQATEQLAAVEVAAAAQAEQQRRAQALVAEQTERLMELQRALASRRAELATATTTVRVQSSQVGTTAAVSPPAFAVATPTPAPAPAPAPAPVPVPTPAPVAPAPTAGATVAVPPAVLAKAKHTAAGRLKVMVDRGELQTALELALNEGDARLVTWLCVHAFRDRGMDAQAALQDMPQFVLLCLVQQLGTDLTEIPLLKLVWLRAACSCLNPDDESIAQVMNSVIVGLRKQLLLCSNLASQHAQTAPAFKSLSMVVTQLLRRLLAGTQ